MGIKKGINKKQNISKDLIQIRNQINKQRDFFNTGSTKEISFRIEQLKKLKSALKKYEPEIMQALYKDLRKSDFESYLTELGVLYSGIDYALANIKKWAKPKRAKTPFSLRPARSRTVAEPYGSVLIIGPWNYPLQLVVAPLIDAIAAGNCAVVKPSSLAHYTSEVIVKIISETFDPAYIYAVKGGTERTPFLITEKFDYIFFTGGTETGRTIMQAAAKELTPVTLELGGKSPAIVSSDAAIDMAAKKITWGKFVNAGQTCIAPDYVLAHKDISEKLVSGIKHYVEIFYGKDPKQSPDFARIISPGHFKRISNLLKKADIVFGGRTDEKELYISPTVAKNISLKHPLMLEEIFGPVLPVLEFSDINEAISTVKSMPKPLALYLFTSGKNIEQRISNEISCGGMVINDTLLHVANHHLPFGGVGFSGIGQYHGKAGFDTFSHIKAVMKSPRSIDLPLRYPPYKNKIKFLKCLFG
ncbi:MAG: aldehyde dehydrogenase [Spirochaetota bacterium]